MPKECQSIAGRFGTTSRFFDSSSRAVSRRFGLPRSRIHWYSCSASTTLPPPSPFPCNPYTPLLPSTLHTRLLTGLAAPPPSFSPPPYILHKDPKLKYYPASYANAQQ